MGNVNGAKDIRIYGMKDWMLGLRDQTIGELRKLEEMSKRKDAFYERVGFALAAARRRKSPLPGHSIRKRPLFCWTNRRRRLTRWRNMKFIPTLISLREQRRRCIYPTGFHPAVSARR